MTNNGWPTQTQAREELTRLLGVEAIPEYAVGENRFSSRLDWDFIDDAFRQDLCQWCYDFVDAAEIKRDVVDIVLNCFDRFLSNAISQEEITPTFCRLTMVSCMFYAVKTHGVVDCDAQDPNAKSNALNQLRTMPFGGEVREDAVLSQEVFILRTLRWFTTPPTTHDFVESFTYLLPAENATLLNLRENVNEDSRFDVELVNTHVKILGKYKASTVALASMLNVMDAYGRQQIPPEIRNVLSWFREYCTSILHLDPAHLREAQEQVATLRSQMFGQGYEASFTVRRAGADAFISPTGVNQV